MKSTSKEVLFSLNWVLAVRINSLVCTPRKILHFAYASFSRMTNELALLVVLTNASVTSRGFNVSKGSARYSRAKCRALSEESCAADE